jgi:hypothetical protein
MKEIWPLMNADKRGSKTNRSSAFIRVHPWLKLFFLLPLLFGVGLGQGVPVVTVCEALQGQYNGKAIVVVGRLHSTDEGSWLGEDCESKIITDRYAWANVISTTCIRSQAKPRHDSPHGFRWNTELMTNKLRDVQKTTRLQEHGDRWVAIFGVFETRSPLQSVTGDGGELIGYGFGHLNYAPAQLTFYNGPHELKPK